MSIFSTETKLLLVTGQARSGTTILTKCLAVHPYVYSTGVESNVFNDILNASRQGSTLNDRRQQMVVSLEEYRLAFRQLVKRIFWPDDLILQAGYSATNPPRFFSTFSSLLPENADELLRVFPETHIACIVRNGIEVVASRMNHEHIGKFSFEEHCVAWQHAIDMARWGRSKDCFTLVRHENLLAKDHASLQFQTLYENAELNYHDAPLNLLFNRHTHQTEVRGESSSDQQDMNKRRERWQFWSDRQRDQFVEICSEAMGYLNYQIPWR